MTHNLKRHVKSMKFDDDSKENTKEELAFSFTMVFEETYILYLKEQKPVKKKASIIKISSIAFTPTPNC
jgi:hypothetical protein